MGMSHVKAISVGHNHVESRQQLQSASGVTKYYPVVVREATIENDDSAT